MMKAEISHTSIAYNKIAGIVRNQWLTGVVVLLALALGVISQYPALFNEYVINGDVPIHIYWMQQFSDPELFNDDILTEFARNIQPYGIIFIYRIASYVMDPLLTSKLLPIALYVLTALYMFKVVKFIGGELSGFFAALLYMTMPGFLLWMVGGTPRSFAYPLVIIFFYYLIKQDHLKASLILLLQAFFYPVVFLVSLLTYSLTFLTFEGVRPTLQFGRIKLISFLFASLIGMAILASKYLPIAKPTFGTAIFTRSELTTPEELTGEGRYSLLPVAPLTLALADVGTNSFIDYVVKSPVYLAIRERKPDFIDTRQVLLLAMCVVGVFLISETAKRKLTFPKELVYVVISAAIMYKLADLLFLRLYIPSRYLEYTIPWVSVIITGLTLGRLTAYIPYKGLKVALTAATIVILLANFNMIGLGLNDKSDKKNLYAYLSTLPKGALIAAPPYLADYIPTFSKRKVLVNYEMSQPIDRLYWPVIKARTRDFFHAYYASEASEVIEFCKKHKIDYLVVDKGDFMAERLTSGNIYFEPFNSEVRAYTLERKKFALLEVRDSEKLFVDDDIFVVGVDAISRSTHGSF